MVRTADSHEALKTSCETTMAKYGLRAIERFCFSCARIEKSAKTKRQPKF
jgi:hypothetical protein